MEEIKLSRKEREKLRQKKEILSIALKLFSRKGYHNVSMQEIAKESEFAVGTIYNFFKSKEDLYVTLILDVAYEIHQKVLFFIEGEEDPLRLVEKFIKAHIEVFKEHSEVVRLYIAEAQGVSFAVRKRIDKEIQKMIEDTRSKLADTFQKGVDKGVFRKLDPKYMAVALDGLVDAFIFFYLRDLEKIDDNMVNIIKEIFLNGVLEKNKKV